MMCGALLVHQFIPQDVYTDLSLLVVLLSCVHGIMLLMDVCSKAI